MTRWLLDTNVLSEPRRTMPNPLVMKFLSGLSQSDMYISVVTLAELQYGAAMAPDLDQRSALQEWINIDIKGFFQGRISLIDETIFYRWKVLFADAKSANRTYSAPDVLIAATAHIHDMIVVTRDVKPFLGLKIPHRNPWEGPDGTPGSL